jgi:FAD/FMN-containing dehydrogenase
MRLVFSEDDLDFQRQLRAAVDPGGLLNPGKLLPPPMERPAPPEPDDTELPIGVEAMPADAAEACQIVRRAYLTRSTLLPTGHGTQLNFGNAGHGVAAPLCSRRLTTVTEYDPAAQVVGVQAGMSLETLQTTLREHGQWLPLRPPRGSQRSLGGIVALNACGPERLRYGAPRDLLLGLKFISGTGRQISAGGRVMKNVAGYDLTRLLAGSAGTLGFLTELTFRILALPQCCRAVGGRGSLAQCGAAAAWLLQSQLDPCFLVAVPDHPAWRVDGDDVWHLIAGFEGFPETVDAQVKTLSKWLAGQAWSCQSPWEYAAPEGVCTAYFDSLYRAPWLWRADLAPDRVVPFLSEHIELARGAGMLVDLGCGRIIASPPDLTDPAWAHWCQAVTAQEGNLVLEKAPDAFRQQHDVFGTPRPNWTLTHKLKRALDPHGVLAPGRLPGKV